MSDSRLYSRLLLPKGHGYPLFHPQPFDDLPLESRRVGTEIGDVGVVTADGSFDVIFNICRPAGDLLNRFGVPEGFEQVYLEPADVASRSQYHRSGSDVSNTRISKRRLDVDAGVESNVFLPLGAGAVVEISTSSKETAVLLLPDGASRTDIRRKKRFRDYTLKHAQRWYAFVNGDLERMVDNGDLYLVTGTDKSASWSLAAVENHSEDCKISLKLKATPVGSAGTSCAWEWETANSFADSGPRPIPTEDKPENQTVFLRGFKVAISSSPLKKSAKAISIVDSKPSEILSKGGSSPFSQSRSTGTASFFRSSAPSGSSGATGNKEALCDSAEHFPGDNNQSINAISIGELNRSDVPSRAGGSPLRQSRQTGPTGIGACFPSPTTSGGGGAVGASAEYFPRNPKAYHPASVINEYLLKSSYSAVVAVTHDDEWMSILNENEKGFPDDCELITRIAGKYRMETSSDRVWLTDGPGGAPLYAGCHASTHHLLAPRLREAIHSLNSKMASLMSQRRDLESRLEQSVWRQSPVLRLPSELLSSIFIIGVRGDTEDNFESVDETKVSIGSIMLVCRYWLEVSLSTPLLWAKIAVSPYHSLEKARRKLARSKSCPLDISINFGARTEYTSSVMEQVVHAMDLFRPALWRIKSFRLSVPNRPQAHAVLLRCQEDAPLLEVLSIRIYHAMQDDNYSLAPLPLFNGRTPRLRSCSLTSFNFGWDVRLVSRLRVLKLGGYFNAHTPSTNTLLGILRECPQLEELALRDLSDVDCAPCFSDSEDFDFPQLTKIVHLPRLKKALFYYAGTALTRQLMAQFTFPNLESLELCYLENVTPVLQLVYTQALTCLPLRRLRIETSLFDEMKLVDVLGRLPSLVTLELVDCEDASSGLLRGLSSSQPWVCPKLESLTLDACTSLDWGSLRTFVESRLPANSHAYPRSQSAAPAFHSSQPTITLASTAAAAHARSRSHLPARNLHPPVYLGPLRLRAIDVTRCSQISQEMVQWLQLHVASVKCQPMP